MLNDSQGKVCLLRPRETESLLTHLVIIRIPSVQFTPYRVEFTLPAGIICVPWTIKVPERGLKSNDAEEPLHPFDGESSD